MSVILWPYFFLYKLELVILLFLQEYLHLAWN